jgi:hypothetical protein
MSALKVIVVILMQAILSSIGHKEANLDLVQKLQIPIKYMLMKREAWLCF